MFAKLQTKLVSSDPFIQNYQYAVGWLLWDFRRGEKGVCFFVVVFMHQFSFKDYKVLGQSTFFQ